MVLGVSTIALIGIVDVPSQTALGIASLGGIILLGAIAFAIRKGTEIEYHPQYNEQTGKVQASTPYAWFANKVRGPRYTYSPPPKQTPSRKHVMAQGFVTAYFLSVVGVTTVGVPQVVYAGIVMSSLIASIILTHFLYERFHGGRDSEAKDG